MSRYFVRPRTQGWVEDEIFSPEGSAPAIPLVSDHEAVDTGLLSVSGEPIMRAPNPIGFGRDAEW